MSARPLTGFATTMRPAIGSRTAVIAWCSLALLSLLLAGCDFQTHSLRMHISDYRQFNPESLQAIFEEQSQLRIVDAGKFSGRSALEVLAANDADLGLVENSAAFTPGIRAVLPVYESVLHVAVRSDFEPAHTGQPLRGARYHIANRSAAGESFVELINRRQGLQPGDYVIEQQFDPEETDLIIYFGPINPDATGWFPPGFQLISLDDDHNPQRRFFHEGIEYNAPKMRPKVIPALTYDLPGNEDDLLTVAVDTLLITRKDVREDLIYELTRTFLVQKPRFTAVAPHLFAGINESFDPLSLNFPLHKGARFYIERDDPGFLERYAETINMLVYVTALLITAFLGLARWRERRKKDRIDIFYERVMAIRRRKGSEDPQVLLQELEALELEAFDSLIREKLAANESFRIFTDLMGRLRSELEGWDGDRGTGDRF